MPGTYSIRQWQNAFTEPAPSVRARLTRLYGDPGGIAETVDIYRQVLDLAAKVLAEEEHVLLIRSPARINLLGTHIDHRGGAVNPVAAKEMVLVARPRDDDLVRLFNIEPDNFAQRDFHILTELPSRKVSDWEAWTRVESLARNRRQLTGDWCNYVKSAVLYLQECERSADGGFPKKLRGMDLFVGSNIPRAASLSSSSALVVATALAANKINELKYSREELVEVCGIAEWYVGTRGGAGDHAAILLGRSGQLMHIDFFPLRITHVPFPTNYRIVLCNTLKEAKKQADARNIFNSRVASYVIGFMMLKQRFPQYGERLERFRDINPAHLGVDEGSIYEMLLALPERVERSEITRHLPEKQQELEEVYQTHDEPPEGYLVRQVCLYGISECLRSQMGLERFQKGDIASFGELMNLSHDGDRVVYFREGMKIPVDRSVPDSTIRALTEGVRSSNPEVAAQSCLYKQPGGYQASSEELDELIDICGGFPGVVGAGLVGAGLGGCIAALVQTERAEGLLEAVNNQYYQPRDLSSAAQVCLVVEGAGLLTL